MTPSPDFSDSSAIARHAAEQIARRDAGWSDADAAEFALWRASDPRHEEVVQRMDATLALLRDLPHAGVAEDLMAEADALERDAQLAPHRPTRQRVRWWRPVLWGSIGLAAASLAVVVVLRDRTGSFLQQTNEPIYHATSERRSVDLDDGSSLLLNRDSEIAVRFAPDQRLIDLRHGEAHFKVAHDTIRPFVVAAGGLHIQAVGTAFNVRYAADESVEVLVTEGTVRVTRADADSAPLTLTRDQSALITRAPTETLPEAAALDGFDRRAKLAWQAPWLAFEHTPLSDAVAQFNRYSPVQLELADPVLGAREVGGRFDAANAAAFASLLATSGDVRLVHADDRHIVLHPATP